MDSDITISLIKAGQIGVLLSLKGFEFLITETNYAEIFYPTERVALDAALASGGLTLYTLNDPDALLDFAVLGRVLGAGEAAVIATAQLLHSEVIMHDRVGRRHAIQRLGLQRVHRLDDLFIHAVRVGCLRPDYADAAASQLQRSGDYELHFLRTGVAADLPDLTFGFDRRPTA